MMEVPNEEVASSLQKVVTDLEGLTDAFATGIGRSVELLTVCVDRSTERLNHVKGLILRASEKRDQVTALLGRRGVSPDMLDTLLAELARDLHTVKNIFEDDKWGDDDSFKQATRIAAAIEGEVRSVNQILHRNFATEKLKKLPQ